MFFDKKKTSVKCEMCGEKLEQRFSFCPSCGNDLRDVAKEKEEFGMLGRNDLIDGEEMMSGQGFGVMDKILSSMVNNMMKNLDKQFKSMDKGVDNTEVRTFPNGVKIKISGPFGAPKKQVPKRDIMKREIGMDQLKKMSSLPRTQAKTNVRRLGDKVVYELATPGVVSAEDVFVSKLESGYEIKAIGDKKIYVNSLAVNLPLKRYSILKNKLLVEFNAGEQQ